jgi:alkylation response protein AidB-like acyl-CoA dehydrogenase
MLARFASRAGSYDRENRFSKEDFEELREAKYLLLPLPSEFGGAVMFRWNGSCGKQPLARSSQPAMRKAEMMCRFCSRPRKRNVSTAATGSRAGSTLVA